MKVIAFSECNPEDFDKISAKAGEIQEERKKFPDRFPKRLRDQDGNHIVYATSISYGKGFMLFEGTDEQLMNLAFRWMPECKLKYMPIFTGFFGAYRKMKK